MMLDREEYVEQAHFFRTLGERLPEKVPIQELFANIRDEILSTTNLPMAIDFLLTELNHIGLIATAMARIAHYFTPFQTYLVAAAEDDRGRFDMRIAIAVLQKEAEYRAQEPSPQGIFLYEFETLSRNRLDYEKGLDAISEDPIFDATWTGWIQNVRRQLGILDFADILYVSSEYYRIRGGTEAGPGSKFPILFGEREGRIALANRQKDPLFLFSALQRQLGYPRVPRPIPPDSTSELVPKMKRQLERLETRVKMLEDESREGSFDLTKFYKAPNQSGDAS